MDSVDVPVALLQTNAAFVYGINFPCHELLVVSARSRMTIEQFRRLLAEVLRARWCNLVELTFKGARLIGEATMERCVVHANTHGLPLQAPRFAATYELIAPGTDLFLQIRVLTFWGGTVTVACRFSFPISMVRQLVTEKVGVPLRHYYLEFNNRALDDRLKLLECNVISDSLLIMRPYNASWLMATGALGVRPGQTPPWQCNAFGRMVIACKGMISFATKADFVRCPSCGERFNWSTARLFDCVWSLDGHLESTGQIDDTKWSEQDFRYQWRSEDAPLWRTNIITARSRFTIQGLPLCQICWDLGPGDKIQTACGHVFHVNCLYAWKQAISVARGVAAAARNLCPDCGQPM